MQTVLLHLLRDSEPSSDQRRLTFRYIVLCYQPSGRSSRKGRRRRVLVGTGRSGRLKE